MDLRKLKTLIDLVQQSGIAELEITEGEERVRISRGVPATGQGMPVAQVVTLPQMPMAAPAAAAAGAAAPAAAEGEAPAPEGHVIRTFTQDTVLRIPAADTPEADRRLLRATGVEAAGVPTRDG